MAPQRSKLRSRSQAVIQCALLVTILASLAAPCSWDYLIWIPRDPSADPLYRFLVPAEDGKYKAGYIDRDGHVTIPPKLESFGGNSGGEFHDGLLHPSITGGTYVNRKGEKVIDLEVESAWDFSEGLAAAMPKGSNKWGYIDTKGNFAIPPTFDTYPLGYVSPFQDGLAKIEAGDKSGYIDHQGVFVIPPRFLKADSFSDGMARVILEGPCVYASLHSSCPEAGTLPGNTTAKDHLPSCGYTFIDKNGQIISADRFDDALQFREGLAPVARNQRWGYIDKQARIVVPFRFERAEPFSEGLALVKEGGLFGFIKTSGDYAIPPQFAHAESFSDGRAMVGDLKSNWYIQNDGRQAFQGTFATASSFYKGVAHVRLKTENRGNKKKPVMAFIDVEGRVLFQY